MPACKRRIQAVQNAMHVLLRKQDSDAYMMASFERAKYWQLVLALPAAHNVHHHQVICRGAMGGQEGSLSARGGRWPALEAHGVSHRLC